MLDPRNEHSDGHISTFDFLGPVNDNYVAMDPCVMQSQNHIKASNLSDVDGIQFRPNKIENGDQSGVCSPPLWSKSTPKSAVHLKPSFNKIRNSPPSLRVQTITRGQKELMEMVKAMPESIYELSLRDLVDHQKVENQEDAIVHDQEKSGLITNKKASVKKQGSIRRQGSVRKQPSLRKVDKKMARTGSNVSESGNKGLFLKMVFPMPFGGDKKKVVKAKGKAKTKENPFAKVSTKLVVDNNSLNDKPSKSVKHKEWWKRRYLVASDDSESSGLSSNGSSGSSGSNDSSGSSISNKSSRKKGGLLHGCSIFHSSKNKTVIG